MKIAVLGGDGFVGWPTALHLSDAGHDIHILDNLSRRWIDTELGVQSLTPMDSIQERTRIWHAETGRRIHFHLIDLARDYELLKNWLAENRPDAVIHFAEQRAAPYSMKSDRHKNYTVNNNVNATHNLLNALVEIGLDAHLVHLGTMGVYGYSTVGAAIPEGYLPVGIETESGETARQDILYPANPGSIYHMTKCLDQLLFQFYAKNDGLRITDLHQGIVWGTHTEQTRRHEQLINRFDYDGDYGTVLNRFLIQAAIGYPLTVHGTGGQTRAFIHIQDSVRCIDLALKNPPQRGARVEIFNQMTETHRIRDLAEMIAGLTGSDIAWLPNPRKEAAENDLVVRNEKFLALGLNPTTLKDGLLEEIVDVGKKYAYRVDRSRVPAVSAWTKDIATKINHDPEGKKAEIRFMIASASDGLAPSRAAASRQAFVTLVTNADYAMGATALARSIRRTETKADIVILHTGGVDPPHLEPLAELGCRLIATALLSLSDTFNDRHARRNIHSAAPFTKGRKPDFHSPLDNFCKLRLWQLVEYERCLFVDADALVLKNIDRFFAYPEFSAAPNVYENLTDFHRLNSGVFIATPSLKTFDAMLTRLDMPDAFWHRTDQTFLQTFFPDWHGLPVTMNMLQYVWFNMPELWDWASIGILHYQYENLGEKDHPKAEILRPLIDLWYAFFTGKDIPEIASLPNPNGLNSGNP